MGKKNRTKKTNTGPPLKDPSLPNRSNEESTQVQNRARSPLQCKFQLWHIGLGLALLLGAFLRFYLLGQQILVDDEWHSLNFVVDKSCLSLFWMQGLGANSVPQNIYHCIVFNSVGFTEWAIRAPSIFFGILSIAVFPILIEKISSRSIATLFAFLLAISPCATFYSRLCRPYSMVLFFGFLAIVCFLNWLKSQDGRFLLAYALSGVIAVYFHLYTAVIIGTPFLFISVAVFLKENHHPVVKSLHLPPIQSLFSTAILMGILSIIFVLPPHLQNPFWAKLYGSGVSEANINTVINTLEMMIGTSSFAIGFAALLLSLLGSYRAYKENPTLSLTLLSPFITTYILLGVSSQEGNHAAIQIIRYSIVLLPCYLFLLCVGIEYLLKLNFIPYALSVALSLIITLALLWQGPFREIYSYPNNFSNHSAFQDSYEPHDWNRSRVRLITPMGQMQKEKIPSLYFKKEFFQNVRGIIEYPFLLGDPYDFYYFYQAHHHLPVAIGYLEGLNFSELPSKNEFIFGTTPLDYVTNRTLKAQAESLHFENVVSLSKMENLKTTHSGWMIFIHKDLWSEIHHPENIMPGLDHKTFGKMGYDLIKEKLGNPNFEDEAIAAWKL